MFDALTHDVLPSAQVLPLFSEGPSYSLSKPALTIAVGFAMLDYRGHMYGPEGGLARILKGLWREDAEEVTALLARIREGAWWGAQAEPESRHGLRAAKLRAMRRSHLQRDRKGLTVGELAERAGVTRETMACALEHHGYLQTAPYGGKQQRRLLTKRAVDAEYGHNVDAAGRSVGLDGHSRATVFPVIYPGHAEAVLWTLDFDGIRQLAAECPTKRHRIAWLLDHHGYLPNVFIGELAGCTERGVRKARDRREAESSDTS